MARTAAAGSALGAFHVHRGHDFEGFLIESEGERSLLVALCACGAWLDVADAVFASCPACVGAVGRCGCARCGGTGLVVDHAALEWRLTEDREERHADDS